jgi:hypothetical protein
MRRILQRKLFSGSKASQSTDSQCSDGNLRQQKLSPPPISSLAYDLEPVERTPPYTPSTSLKALKIALSGLIKASNVIPMPGVATSAETLLKVLNQLEVHCDVFLAKTNLTFFR